MEKLPMRNPFRTGDIVYKIGNPEKIATVFGIEINDDYCRIGRWDKKTNHTQYEAVAYLDLFLLDRPKKKEEKMIEDEPKRYRTKCISKFVGTQVGKTSMGDIILEMDKVRSNDDSLIMTFPEKDLELIEPKKLLVFRGSLVSKNPTGRHLHMENCFSYESGTIETGDLLLHENGTIYHVTENAVKVAEFETASTFKGRKILTEEIGGKK